MADHTLDEGRLWQFLGAGGAQQKRGNNKRDKNLYRKSAKDAKITLFSLCAFVV
jgi:hypothetical protein